MNRDDLLIELALVSQWVFLEKYGLAYRLKNGNFGMQFNDKTQIYMFLENGNFKLYTTFNYLNFSVPFYIIGYYWGILRRDKYFKISVIV